MALSYIYFRGIKGLYYTLVLISYIMVVTLFIRFTDIVITIPGIIGVIILYILEYLVLLKTVRNKENEKGFNVDNIYGIKRVVSFNKEIIKKIVNSSDEIKEFSKFCEDIQYIDAYSAKQSFVEDTITKEKWGYYVLTENLRTVLPYKPNVEFFSMDYIKNEEIAFWKIFFCAYKVDENGEEGIDKIGESIYDDFIKKLPTDKYKFIDASYIVVEPLNRDDIEKMLK